ncbi:hypothetical protein [Paeniglutamicibacter cryotolerans]|uniref:Uncharacterized protein n=1 Tax=Paeniglutamicibacter cryotolerans TaxID=670079 RepID=A0A839QPN2_9MICC|nr:hypothetical protein [Paeniglutamicibacter cryotolerans]MBB2997563.1 hypothetical protein [Paeniglutamicibacter cryotolerans]
MSDEGVEEIVESLLRQGLVAASQLAEQLARARSQYLAKAERDGERAALEARRIMVGDRAMMRALILPTTADQWWATAKPAQIIEVHLMAQAWKAHDPEALVASEKINREIKDRYGIDTADAGDDVPYLQDRLAVQQLAEQQQRVAREHAEAMELVARAQKIELARVAAELHEQMQTHRVPAEYLSNHELVTALQGVKDATGEQAELAAERAVAERMHLIEQDGIHGPEVGQLRDEIGAHYAGVGDQAWTDAGFVVAARRWHEARMLATGGFVDSEPAQGESRYQIAEKDLLARRDALHQVGASRELRDDSADRMNPTGQLLGGPTPGLEGSAGKGGPVYGSAEYYREFERSLRGLATEGEITGRMAAARSQGKHPSEAVTGLTPAPMVRKTAFEVGLEQTRNQEGPAR